MSLGYHMLIDFYECDKNKISDIKKVEEILISTAKELNATIISSNFNNFYPYGVSGVLIIAESHFTIHTWVDEKMCAIDLFVCDPKIDLKKGAKILKEKFEAKREDIKLFHRLPLKEAI